MNNIDRELFALYVTASPEKKAAVETVLKMLESGHTIEDAIAAIKDDSIRERAQSFMLQQA